MASPLQPENNSCRGDARHFLRSISRPELQLPVSVSTVDMLLSQISYKTDGQPCSTTGYSSTLHATVTQLSAAKPKWLLLYPAASQGYQRSPWGKGTFIPFSQRKNQKSPQCSFLSLCWLFFQHRL